MSRRLTALVGCLLATIVVAGCQTDLGIERYEYLCNSSAECTDGYQCAHLQDRHQSICVPPDQVESCTTVGDEDGDGAPDCDDQECAGFAGCDLDTGRDDTGDHDAGDDVGQDTDAQGDVDVSLPDEDGDGVADNQDNCPEHYNPDQIASGVAGVGRACADVLSVEQAELILYESTFMAGAAGGGTAGGGVAVLGDLDGDGLDEIAIGTPAAENGEGVVSVLLSSTTPSSGALKLTMPTTIRLSAPNSDGSFGEAVAAIGDLDGDGFSELAVGQPRYLGQAGEQVGAVHLYNGARLLEGPSSPHRSLLGVVEGALVGSAIVALDDVDADGMPDFAVGAPETPEGSPDNPSPALVFVVSGSNLEELRDLGDAVVSIQGEQGSGFGGAIAAGDFDKDGRLDLAMGAPQANGTGLVYLFYGSTIAGWESRAIDLAQDDSADLSISTADSSGNFGASIALAGSLNGDHFDDLVIGSQWETASQVGDLAGAAYVLLGTDNFASGASVSIQDVADLKVRGVEQGQLLGTSVTYVGDINADGRDDLVAGAKDSGSLSKGGAYLLVGPYTQALDAEAGVAVTDIAVSFEGMHPYDNLGLKAAPAGSHAGGEFDGFFVYAPAGDIPDGAVDKPTWYHFSGPFY